MLHTTCYDGTQFRCFHDEGHLRLEVLYPEDAPNDWGPWGGSYYPLATDDAMLAEASILRQAVRSHIAEYLTSLLPKPTISSTTILQEA